MRVYGYGRASTSAQCLSTSQQESVVRDAFEYKKRTRAEWADAEWGGFIADEATSRDSCFRERSGGSLLLTFIRPGDAVIVSKFDRLVVGVSDAENTFAIFRERRASVLILDCGGMEMDTSTPYGEVLFVLVALFKKLELHDIRQRTKDAMDHRRRMGRPASGAYVGWQIKAFIVPGMSGPQKYLVPDNPARRLAREIYNVKMTHNFGYDRARRFCNENGILRKNRKKWHKLTFDKWCNAARDNFVLPNGNHEAAPIPPNAIPITYKTCDD